MKKVLVLTLVLSVVGGSGAAEACLSKDKAVSTDIVLTAPAVTVFEIQADAGSTYIVCVETVSQPSDKKDDDAKYAAIIGLLPEPITIVMLGLCGFMLRRRKNTYR